jgi:3-hydroxyisobutyrate dehydrogenase-like beta-hydroxyacid dehydrogenase
MKVGFVGLGMMGSRMAKNIGRAGYPLMVYDMNKSNSESILKQVNSSNVSIASSIVQSSTPVTRTTGWQSFCGKVSS